MINSLSERLQTIADMVSPDLIVADIGTDHGYVPIYLLSEKKIPFAYATDISSDCLCRAKINAKKAGVFESMKLIVSDGLDSFEDYDVAESLIISGIGGNLICDILERAKNSNKLSKFKEIILSPQRDISKVRRILRKLKFEIAEERIIKEGGKFYFLIKAVPSKILLKDEDEIYYEFGKFLLEKKDSLLREFLLLNLNLYNDILNGPVSGDDRLSIERKKALVSDALNYF